MPTPGDFPPTIHGHPSPLRPMRSPRRGRTRRAADGPPRRPRGRSFIRAQRAPEDSEGPRCRAEADPVPTVDSFTKPPLPLRHSRCRESSAPVLFGTWKTRRSTGRFAVISRSVVVWSSLPVARSVSRASNGKRTPATGRKSLHTVRSWSARGRWGWSAFRTRERVTRSSTGRRGTASETRRPESDRARNSGFRRSPRAPRVGGDARAPPFRGDPGCWSAAGPSGATTAAPAALAAFGGASPGICQPFVPSKASVKTRFPPMDTSIRIRPRRSTRQTPSAV